MGKYSTQLQLCEFAELNSAKSKGLAQGRTVRVFFEKIQDFRDFSLISQGPQGSPGGFQTNFENFWLRTMTCDL